MKFYIILFQSEMCKSPRKIFFILIRHLIFVQKLREIVVRKRKNEYNKFYAWNILEGSPRNIWKTQKR